MGNPDIAPRSDKLDVIHGRVVRDPYRWLEDPASDETRRWLAAQDELFRAHAGGWAHRDRLRRRLADLLSFEAVSVPVWRGSRWFLTRQGPGRDHPVLLAGGDGGERLLLDPVALDPSGLTTLDAWEPSWEGHRIAVQTSVAGSERGELVVVDTTTGQVVDGPIDRVRYSPVAWLPGGTAFYYVRSARGDSVERQVRFHAVGSDPGRDAVVVGGAGTGPAIPGVTVSPDGRWLTVSLTSRIGLRNDLWLADLHAQDPRVPALRPVQVGVEALTGPHLGHDGRYYLLTTWRAPRSRLCVTTPDRPDPRHWRQLLPEDPEATLDEIALLTDPDTAGTRILAAWTRQASSQLTLHDAADGRRTATLELPGRGTASRLTSPPAGGPRAWFRYTDPSTPPSVWCVDLARGQVRPWVPVPSPPDPPPVHHHHTRCVSADGTPVPLTIISPRPRPDRPRPTILNVYGAFGHKRRLGFTASVLAWLEGEGVYAVAHARGGGEVGTRWHRAGTGPGKRRTIEDTMAAAEHLVGEGWTTPDRLCLSGGSNGGLIAAAAVIRSPRLCNAVVASAPLADMARYEHHGLGRLWTGEYGSATDPAALQWLLTYSPYHTVEAGGPYPATLFTVFEQDSRVDPLHARKLCAALQWATSSDRPVLLRREEDVGHGPRALSRAIDVAADALAFAREWTSPSRQPADRYPHPMKQERR